MLALSNLDNLYNHLITGSNLKTNFGKALSLAMLLLPFPFNLFKNVTPNTKLNVFLGLKPLQINLPLFFHLGVTNMSPNLFAIKLILWLALKNNLLNKSNRNMLTTVTTANNVLNSKNFKTTTSNLTIVHWSINLLLQKKKFRNLKNLAPTPPTPGRKKPTDHIWSL